MPNADLRDEIEAINAIYGEGSLEAASEQSVFILRLPQPSMSLRLSFPDDYPAAPPSILGTETSKGQSHKGAGASVLQLFKDILGNLYQPGEVCLFNVIEEVNSRLNSVAELINDGADVVYTDMESYDWNHGEGNIISKGFEQPSGVDEPAWVVSEVVTELKSVFIARCAPVSSSEQAKYFVEHLLDGDKKLRSATHNITAWRILGEHGVVFQDCDDDGETAAGSRVLHLMQLMGIWNCVVVVTRWYGGHQLGPKRFSIINAVARDCFVKGNFVPKEPSATKKKKRQR